MQQQQIEPDIDLTINYTHIYDKSVAQGHIAYA